MSRRTTFEGQRTPDQGDGTYLNPILSGDHPDPTILKDGADYYMTFSSFESYPGIVLWHSTDLVNWSPICAALTKPLGPIWALDLVKHNGRYFLYIPGMGPPQSIYVIWADNIRGPWSEPIDLKLGDSIDPGHVVGEDGKRYLFVNGIRRIQLTDDGLATVGALEHACEPWRYPEDWVVEMFAPEGPKLLRKGDYFYLISAVGGTSGPPTSHMVTVARSKSVRGPWENCPFNPIVHTESEAEPWWSRGHASLVEGPAGDWWMIYHGYENNFRTLGRQTLMEPVEWTPDGWIRALGGDLSKPLPKPVGGRKSSASLALSDDFSSNKFGIQWSFFDPAPDEAKRVNYTPGCLVLAARGDALTDSSALTFVVGDLRYQVEVELQPDAGCQGGLILQYNQKMFVGIGFDGTKLSTYNGGQEQSWMRKDLSAARLWLRMENNRNVITFWHSVDGSQWTKVSWQMEVSGLHHNVFGGFLSLRPGLFSVGTGAARYRNFKYQGALS